jgi:hypothetical protein
MMTSPEWPLSTCGQHTVVWCVLCATCTLRYRGAIKMGFPATVRHALEAADRHWHTEFLELAAWLLSVARRASRGTKLTAR